MKKFLFAVLTLVLLSLANHSAKAQANVLDPTDPDVIFTSTNQPAAPAYGKISKWGHTSDYSWNPYSYGYKSYYFDGMAFRLRFPKSYKPNVADGKIYPVYIFLHGLGEYGSIYDNELQLVHGGQLHAQAVIDSTFDGFLLYPQSNSGWLQAYSPVIIGLLDSLVKNVKADPDRVIMEGLSAGGQACWDFMNTSYMPQITSMIAISAAKVDDIKYFPGSITIPMWETNGGQDQDPAPGLATQVIDSFLVLGGNITQTVFPTEGHDTWDSLWLLPNYFPFLNAQHKANPLVYFQRTQFCPNDVVNVKLGLQPGFYAYQWENNSITIPNATSSQLQVTSYGAYQARFKRTSTSNWSLWSPAPVVISQKQGTVSPPIQINGLYSNLLPAPDGSTAVPLFVPNTYASYEWHSVAGGKDSIVSTTSTYAAPIGQYKVRVTEQFGCSSNFSPVYSVIAANSASAPSQATNLSAVSLSNTSVSLNWSSNPHPVNSPTAFEIYRSTTSGSNYEMVDSVGTNILTLIDQGLSPATKYYYVVRAVNYNGAALLSNEANAATTSDTTAPSAPTNLIVIGTTRNTVSLSWNPSTDNVGVYKYDVYINGVKAYSTSNTTITVANLTAFQTYAFSIKARDASGNLSPSSNQVSAIAKLSGLTFNYYQGAFTVLPDFTTITPLLTGSTLNVSLTPALQTTNFAFLWQGYIIIPTTGTYTFETNSDDGSDLYIGQYSPTATPLVNNDGLHAAQSKTGKITLTAGVYPITITYFQSGGGTNMQIYWTNTAAGISRQLIPNSAFSDVVTAGAVPATPGFLNALASSYNRINLSWTDNSTNETGFEVSRGTQRLGDYVPIGTTGSNVTTFSDSVGLSSNTKYWYKVRAVNVNGASGFISNLQGSWLFNNDLTDGSGNGNSLTGSGSPTFSTNAKEGSNSLSLNGTAQYADMTFSAGGLFPSDSYTTRTIGLWINPTAATISGANKLVFDLGGSDNGIGLRFNSGTLQAGIASKSVRSTITVNNIATDANWVNGGWNYVTVVYNVNTLQLYVNDILKGTANLSFSSIATSTIGSRIGASNGTNAFNSATTSTNYGGLIDDIEILTEPVNTTGISGLMNQSYTADTTLALPAVPAAPSNLTAQTLSSSKISLSFTDNSNNETGFQIYRSVIDTTNFRLQTTLGSGNGIGSKVNYSDTGLYANTNYYYKVNAIGVGGSSAFTSPNILAVTLDNKPYITKINGFAFRYGTQVSIPVAAVDQDGDVITFSTINLPVFGTLTNVSNGLATLQLNPAITNQGSYTISVVANDGHSGTDTTTFTVIVNSNYVPVIVPASNQSINEGDSVVVPLTATDQDGNSTLTWSVINAPSFVSIGSSNNGIANLTLKPGYAAAGNYNIITTVNDGAGGIASDTFTLAVINKSPSSQKIYMDMRYNSPNAPAPWNNISAVTSNNLLDNNGNATGVGLQFLNTPWNAGNASNSTGNNSGIYPDASIADYFWFGAYGAPSTVNFVLTGLNQSSSYNLTLFASSDWTGAGPNGTTVYTLNGVQKSIFVQSNTQNTVTFNGITPDNSGNITVNMSVTAGTPYGLINTIVLEKPFDDGTVPALPINLAVQALSNGYAKLTWTNIAYNATGNSVYRAMNAAGPYTLLNPGASNAGDSTYTDSTVSGNTTYYYEIASINAHGTSGQTAPVSVVTLNKTPVLNALNNVYIRAAKTSVVNITPVDDPTNTLTTTVSNLPAFATYQSTGNGKGTITIAPGLNDVGIYNSIIVNVTDNFGASAADTFNIDVTDSALRSVYVNFGPLGGTPQPAPWNNYLSYPFANNPLSNLVDDANSNTGFSIKILDQWDGNFELGMITGNNTGIVPDNVMQSSFETGVAGGHIVEIDGLNPAKRYNIGVMSSLDAGNNDSLIITSGTQTVRFNGMYNSNAMAFLNGLTPTAAGAIQVTLTKGPSAAYINLNAIEIEEYSSTTPIVRPFNLFAESILDSGKVKLTWSDRSSNETGFQIYRSTSPFGTYTLVTTTAANVTTYTNTGLTPNVRYFFKVRAINGTITSNYTNIATVILSSKIVYINLNFSAAQNTAAPWNNTNGPSVAGETFSNLLDNTGNNSGDEMIITEEFNGAGFAGVTTNGVLPGTVMSSNYWTDAGQTSEVKFDNLDVRRQYRIGVFGSAISTGYFMCNYTCNGKTVQLNSLNNSTKVVYLDKLVPNSNGELYLDASTVTGFPYSFTSAFTIESYTDTSTFVPVILSRPAASNDSAVTATSIANTTTTNADVRVYPNPFSNRLTVELNENAPGKVALSLYDANLKLVYKGGIEKAYGTHTYNVEIPNANSLSAGSYIFNVITNGKLSKSVVLIKVN